jgi:hypothetical protein
MRFFLFLILFFTHFPFDSIAQSSWKIGFQAYGNISDGLPKNTSNANYFKGTETMLFSYSGGIQLRYQTKKDWRFVTGILLQKIGDRSKIFSADSAFYLFSPFRIKSSLYYIELPANFEGVFHSNYYYTIGVSPSIVVYNNTKLFYPTENILVHERMDILFSRLNLFLNAGIGKDIQMHKMKLNLGVYAQYGLFAGFKGYSSNYHSPDIPERNNLSFGIKVSQIF